MPADLDVRRILRKTVAAHHRELDSQPCFCVLRGELDLTHERYVTALMALYAPHLAVESEVLRGIQEYGVDYHFEPRAAALSDDLMALGYAPEVHESLTIVDSLAALLGALYVLEGGKRGSIHIERQIIQNGSRLPTSFFSAGHQLTSLEPFWALLEAQELSTSFTQKVAAAACQTFDLFIDSAKRCSQ